MLVKLETNEKKDVLSVLNQQGYELPYTPCGGKGTCGKCRVFIISGEVSPKTENELKISSLAEGERLACQTYFKGKIEIEIPDVNEVRKKGGNFLSSYVGNFNISESAVKPGKFAFAVDIGTTTIAIVLINLENGKIIDTVTAMNAQEKFGADVITRIGYVKENNSLEEVSKTIQNQLAIMFKSILHNNEINPELVTEVSIAANTTMCHLLVGADPIGIAVAPFTPKFLESRVFSSEELNLGLPQASIFLAGGISSYVGGDITSGILGLNFFKDNKKKLLIDLGTNGEIALFDGENIHSCSCAAGPVFEGATLSCGMPGIAGAISHFKDDEHKIIFSTIGNEKPVGICGSGIIDITKILLENEIIDETGYMEDSPYYIPETNIYIDQKDIRQIQLAKAAISAGIRTLLEHANLKKTDIDTVYLAGGLGTFLDSNGAIAIGLLETEWKNKIVSCGNSSLNGAVSTIMNPDKKNEIEMIRKEAGYLELSNSSRFQELFVESMIFGD